MTLVIAIRGPEGIALAADSRVTLNNQATYDNVTKLFQVSGQPHIGVLTFNRAIISVADPRTAHSFIPEFEAQLANEDVSRLRVEDFGTRLGAFFNDQFTQAGIEGPPDMNFYVAGYDEGDAYGRVLTLRVPSAPTPVDQFGDHFGILRGGQGKVAQRLLDGFDEELVAKVKQSLSLDDEQTARLRVSLREACPAKIPYQVLALQDGVDLAIFCIRSTIAMQSWETAARGVGGAIDVATITRAEGFQWVQKKAITGEHP